MANTSLFLDEIIENASKDLNFNDIWIAGFSQEAYMALYYGLQHNKKITHIQAIAGNFHNSMMPANLETKNIWLHCGKKDPHISEEKMFF